MSFWTGLAGSILVPVAGAALTRLSHEVDPIKDTDDVLFRIALLHGAVAFGSYIVSQHTASDAMHDFAIGGALSEALATGLALYGSVQEHEHPRSTASTASTAATSTGTETADVAKLLASGGASDSFDFPMLASLARLARR